MAFYKIYSYVTFELSTVHCYGNHKLRNFRASVHRYLTLTYKDIITEGTSGARGSVVVEALNYKPEGRGIAS
jgi:hypothetical protein